MAKVVSHWLTLSVSIVCPSETLTLVKYNDTFAISLAHSSHYELLVCVVLAPLPVSNLFRIKYFLHKIRVADLLAYMLEFYCPYVFYFMLVLLRTFQIKTVLPH